MKTYTDIEQSKKLAKILPIESADMYWEYDLMQKFHRIQLFEEGFSKTIQKDDVPCWSLAALLNVIPTHLIKRDNVLRIDISDNNFAMWYDGIGYGVNSSLPDITKDNPIDACYEMILKLHEQNLL